MSTVRMARYLVYEIRDRFEQNFDKAYPEKEIPTTVGDKLYECLMGVKLPRLQKVMEEEFGDQVDMDKFFIKASYLSIEAPVYRESRNWSSDKQEYEIEGEIEKHRFSVPLSTEMLMPNDASRYSDSPITFKLTGQENIHIKDAIKFVEYENKRDMKRRKDTAQVEKTVKQFTTLNQALKAWPALAKLCPPEKVSKVHEKQQRKRKEAQNRAKIEPIEQELNQTILTASLLED